MTQQPGDLVPVSNGQKGLIAAVGGRLVGASSPQKIVLWTQVREEILRQNNDSNDRKHRRDLERLQNIFNMGMSLSAVLIGVIFVFVHFEIIGIFLLGLGFMA